MWVVLGVAVGLAGAAAYLAVTERIFISNARVYIAKDGMALISEQYSAELASEAAIIKSSRIIEAVAARDDIKALPMFRGKNVESMIWGSLSVSAGKKDKTVWISMAGAEPKDLGIVANAMVDSYIEFKKESGRNAAGEVIRIIDEERVKQEAELRQKDDRLTALRQDGAAVVGTMPSEALQEQMAQFTTALTTTQLDVINSRADYEVAKGLVESGEGAAMTDSQADSALASRKKQVEMERSRFIERGLTEQHPSVRQLTSLLVDLDRMLEQASVESSDVYVASMHQRLMASERKLDAVQNALAEVQKKAAAASSYVTSVTRLQADVVRLERSLDTLYARGKETSLAHNAGGLEVKILDRATDGRLESPKPAATVALGGIGGLLLGGLLAFVRESTDQRVRKPDAIESLVGVPVLARVPTVGRRLINASGLASITDPMSLMGEAMRELRTSVCHGRQMAGRTTLLVVGLDEDSMPGVVASNLGAALAASKRRTVLVDCNLRSPMLHDLHQLDNSEGLTSVMLEKQTLGAALRRSPLETLQLLVSGPVSGNPSDVVGSPRFGHVLTSLKQNFEFVIATAPSLLGHADARSVAARVDGVILVVRESSLRSDELQRAQSILAEMNAELLGVVSVTTQSERYSSPTATLEARLGSTVRNGAGASQAPISHGAMAS